MKIVPFPGYENHLLSYLREDNEELQKRRAAQGQAMLDYKTPDGMKIENRVISGGDGQDMNIRVYTPANLPANAPMVLEVHGGAFVGGNLDIDNARCIAIASRVPCVVVGVEYRLCNDGKTHFPKPLEDVHAAYVWMQEHAAELGGDAKHIGLHGSSAGGTLCAGLALYLRDHGELTPALTVANCACYTTAISGTTAYQQLSQFVMGPEEKAQGAEFAYLGGYDGTQPSYYAFPLFCHDLGGLGPHFIICAEYDTLRDGSLDYARRLLENGVPVELLMGGRVGHCFTAAPHPYTDQTHDAIATAFRREFGLLDHLKKKV